MKSDVELEAIRAATLPYVEKLKTLDTPKKIRDFLLEQDIKARAGSATHCAIGAYVAESGCVVGVSQNHIYAYTTACEGRSVCVWPVIADNSEAMKQFVYDFDDGFYPELVG